MVSMNFEVLEQFRMENTRDVMAALTKIVCDEKEKVEDRLNAAKVLDAMSDSIIKANLITNVTDVQEKGLKRQIDSLTDNRDK